MSTIWVKRNICDLVYATNTYKSKANQYLIIMLADEQKIHLDLKLSHNVVTNIRCHNVLRFALDKQSLSRWNMCLMTLLCQDSR